MNLTEFYPTPVDVAEKLLEGLDFNAIMNVLEPSAGDGSLAEVIQKKINEVGKWWHNKKQYGEIDCIEIEPSLRAILKDKGLRVVDSDFLHNTTIKKYDLIVMNPPFSDGDKHLLKALKMQEYGGKIRAILNAQTLKNPYSNIRKELLQKLEEYDAEIEYVTEAFSSATRKTDVEIAIIKVDIPERTVESDILKNMTLAEEEREKTYDKEYTEVTQNNIYEAFVKSFNIEANAGKKFLEEYKTLKELFQHGCERYSQPLIELENDNHNGNIVNDFLKRLRRKYWELIFSRPEFTELFTSSLRESYMKKISELSNYDFNMHNILEARLELSKSLLKGLDDNIMGLFETFTTKYSWYPECQNNIHYYNGWSTNKAYYVNKKVIIPIKAYDGIFKRFKYNYDVLRMFSDIERAFDYLDGKDRSEYYSLEKTLKVAEEFQETMISLKYFDVVFYKKGTCHIAFNDLDLLKKLNIYAGRKFNWLPTDYGQKSYGEMSEEERAVVDSFEGKKAYEETFKNKDYFLATENNSIKLLCG